jgi:hypothetical protein
MDKIEHPNALKPACIVANRGTQPADKGSWDGSFGGSEGQ